MVQSPGAARNEVSSRRDGIETKTNQLDKLQTVVNLYNEWPMVFVVQCVSSFKLYAHRAY